MKKKIADIIPIRQLLSALAAFGLAWTLVGAWSDIFKYPNRSPYEKHQQWLIVEVFCIVTCVAVLSALTPRASSPDGHATCFGIRKLIEHLRVGLFKITVVLLEVVLIATFCSLIGFSFIDGKPTIQWGRIGGVMTDWVIEVCLVLPLLLGAIVFNLTLLSSKGQK